MIEISDRIWRIDPNLKCIYCGKEYKKHGWLKRHCLLKHNAPLAGLLTTKQTGLNRKWLEDDMAGRKYERITV